jgi:hypothetical protein
MVRAVGGRAAVFDERVQRNMPILFERERRRELERYEVFETRTPIQV